MPVPEFDPIDFDNADKPYEGGQGYVEKLKQLSTNFTALRDHNSEVQLSVEGQTAALLAGTEADRVAAEAFKNTSYQNALSAAAAAGQATDSTANIAAILKTRGITNIKAIAFKKAEGWEKQGRQSYKTETRPTGRFLGDYASVALAWAQIAVTPASANEDVYWDSTDKAQYKLSGGNSRTINYRYGSAEMPAECVFVFTTTALYVFDLTNPLVPLWMQFTRGSNTLYSCSSAADFTSISAGVLFINGKLIYGTNGAASGMSFRILDFISDKQVFINLTATSTFSGGIALRNSALGYKTLNTNSISHNPIYGVAYYNGYSAVATLGGVSVIKPDGTVVRSSDTVSYTTIFILNGRLYGSRTTSSDQIYNFGPIDQLGASFATVDTFRSDTHPQLTTTSSAHISSITSAEDRFVVSSIVKSSIDVVWPNPADKTAGLIARKGLTFATPPMKKPELMLICSTSTGSISPTELVTNGATFADTTGWTANAGATLAVDAGRLKVSQTTTDFVSGYQAITTVVGQVYEIFHDLIDDGSSNNSGVIYVRSGPTSGAITTSASGFGTAKRTTFKAIGTTTYLCPGLGSSTDNIYALFDNISCKIALEDYSGLSRHATINGTLTATAEVTGGVAGLSGFTVNTNYLSAANPWSGIGTGDGWIAGAFKCAASVVSERIAQLGYWDGAAFQNAVVRFELLDDGRAYVRASNDAESTSVSATATSTYDDGLVHTYIVRKTSTSYELHIDGQLVASVAVGAHGNLTFHASATMFVGRSVHGTSVAPNSTVWFASAGKVGLTAAEVALLHRHMRNQILNKANLDGIPSALAYNELTGAVELIGTTYHQTLVNGAITNSVAHGVGTTPAIACGSRGEVGYGGTTSVVASVPARNLRDYQARKTTERFTVKYLGDSSRTKFPDPAIAAEIAVTIGAKPISVVDNGVVLVQGASDAYTVKDGGLGRYYADIAVAPGATKVIVTFEREVWK